MQLKLSGSIMDEFTKAQLGDKRLNKRLCHIAEDLAQQPRVSLPQASGDWGQACAAYRFFDNDRIEPADLLAPHQARTRERAASVPLALAVSDTTGLNYNERPDTSGLGPISTRADKHFGLWCHSLLAFTAEGMPLGVLHSQCWARDPAQFGSKSKRHQRPIEQKESAKWLRSFQALQTHATQTPQTRWVMVADREADLYELFEWAQRSPEGPAVLVRALHNRNLEGMERRLFAHLAQVAVAGKIQIQVPRRRGQPGRTATLAVRFSEVCLRAPAGKAKRPVLTLWAVEAREVHSPKGQTPIHWRLLSTVRTSTPAEAIERLRWYCVRWGIEVFHKVLKSGCAVEEVQLQTAARLKRYITLKLVVAWQVMALVKLGRQQPDLALSEILDETEWRALRALEYERRKRSRAKTKRLPARPTVEDGTQWIGRLGGHLGRRGDGLPGPLRLARGLERLHDITIGWSLAQEAKQCA
jgi:hypothetical protein